MIGSLTPPKAILVTDIGEAQVCPWHLADVWDFETTGLYWWRDDPYALAVLMGDQPYVFVGEALEWAQFRLVDVITAQPDREVIAYNAKFDMHFASRETLPVRARIIDPMVALFLIDENRFSGAGNGGLKAVVKHLFGYEMVDFKRMLGSVSEETGEYKTRKCKTCAGKGWRGRDHSQCEPCAGVGMEARPVIRRRLRHISEVPLDVLAQYAGEDVWWTKRVWEWAKAALAKNRTLEQNFHEVQMPLLMALYDAEHHGVRIDMDGVVALREKYVAEIAAIDAAIRVRTGIAVEGATAIDVGDDDEPSEDGGDGPDDPTQEIREDALRVNLGSPAQVDWFVYTFLGLRRPTFHPKRKGKDGRRVASKWQTDENCLLWVWKNSRKDVAKLILERRKLAKYIGTYLDNMLAFSHEEAPGVWVLYPNFNQTVAKTGRLSSSKPLNFQNIPRLEAFRSLFIARPGCALVIADASQIELRFLAHFSNDPSLTGPYSDPSRDLHQETADFLQLEGSAGRYVAKTFNFAEVYEVYGNTAAMQLFRDTEGEINWTKDQAQDVLDRLRAGRPLVRRWKMNTVNFLKAHKHVKSIEGLYRRLPGIDSPDWGAKKYAERQGINAKIQGSVKDLFARLLGNPMFTGRFRLQVHDEVVCEVPVEQAEQYGQDVKRAIEGFTERYEMRVPILASVGIGKDWSAK